MAEIKQPMGIQPEGSQRYMGKDAPPNEYNGR